MPKRIVACLFGDVKTRKTTFALTFPEPIFFFDWNFGLEGVIEREEFNGKEIDVKQYGLLPFSNAAEMEPVVERFKKEYRAALSKAPAGATIVVDTASDLDDVIQTVTLNRWVEQHPRSQGKQVPSLAYGERNSTMFSVFSGPLQRKDLNGVFIHRSKPEYDGDTKTGRMELAGWAGGPGETQITIQTLKSGKDYKGRIVHSRLGTDLEGTVMDELTHEFLSALVG